MINSLKTLQDWWMTSSQSDEEVLWIRSMINTEKNTPGHITVKLHTCKNILISKAVRGGIRQIIFKEGLIRLLNRNDGNQKTMEFYLPMWILRQQKSFKIVTHPRINSKSKISSKYHQLKKFQILPYKGKQWKQWQTLFWGGSKITADGDCSHEIKRCLLLGRKVMTNLDSILKNRGITLSTKVHLVKANGFSSSHVWMWQLDHKKSWALKNWCFWTVVLEKTLESPLDCKEIQPVYPKGNQPWIFIGETDAEVQIPKLWPPAAKNWLIRTDPNTGKD